MMPSTPVNVYGAVIGAPSSVSCAFDRLLSMRTTDVSGNTSTDEVCVRPDESRTVRNNRYQTLDGCFAAVRDRERAARDAAGRRHVRMRVSVMMEVHSPRERARRQRAVFEIRSRAGEREGLSAAIAGAGGRRADRSRRCAIAHHRQRCRVAGRGAPVVAHDGAECRTVVSCSRRLHRVSRRRGIRDVRAVALPLIGHRRRARCSDAETRRLAHGHRPVRRIRRDARRRVRGVLNPIHVAAAACQVVQRTVGCNLNVDQLADAGREGRRARIAGRAQHADEAGAEVAEEVATGVRGREVRRRRPIESCTGDRAAV